MKYGVTTDGFKRKTYVEVIEDMESLAKELFGEDIDLSERNPLGMSLQNIGWEISTLWEMAEDVYNSPFIDTSEGLALDSTGKYIAITRKAALPSNGIITIEGTTDTRIPKGFRVSTDKSEVVFETTIRATLDLEGKADIPIISVENGLQNNVPAQTITKIVNPVGGVRRVYNKEVTIDGLDTETDKDFRERYYRSVSLGGSSTRESVEAELLNIADVTDAFVQENDTMEYIEDIPPKSLAPYVFGGDDEVIANIILENKAGGIRSYGLIEVDAVDDLGVSHTIGFTRPTVKEIHLEINIEPGQGYPSKEVIKRAVINYVGGIDEDGIEYKGLKLGEDVVISKLMASVMSLQGIKDMTVGISLDGVDYTDDNITINKKEIARTKYDKVVINHV